MDLFCIFGKDQDQVRDGLSPVLLQAWDEFRVDTAPEEFDAEVAEYQADPHWVEVRVVIIEVDDGALDKKFEPSKLEGTISGG